MDRISCGFAGIEVDGVLPSTPGKPGTDLSRVTNRVVRGRASTVGPSNIDRPVTLVTDLQMGACGAKYIITNFGVERTVIWSALIFTDRTINVRSCAGSGTKIRMTRRTFADGLVNLPGPFRARTVKAPYANFDISPLSKERGAL
jgi:hypothetical protein